MSRYLELSQALSETLNAKQVPVSPAVLLAHEFQAYLNAPPESIRVLRNASAKSQPDITTFDLEIKIGASARYRMATFPFAISTLGSGFLVRSGHREWRVNLEEGFQVVCEALYDDLAALARTPDKDTYQYISGHSTTIKKIAGN